MDVQNRHNAFWQLQVKWIVVLLLATVHLLNHEVTAALALHEDVGVLLLQRRIRK
jgi:hypothetical protein